MRLVKVLLVVIFLIGSWLGWVILGHEYRTLQRLVSSKLVASPLNIKLIHSSGYRRENFHIFSCPENVISNILSGENQFTQLDTIDHEIGSAASHAKSLLDAHVVPPLDWDKAVIFTAEGRDPISMLFLVKEGSRGFILMEVF